MFYFLDRILLRLQSARRVSSKTKTQQAINASAKPSTAEPSANGAKRVKSHPWIVAHEETNVSRNRAVVDAAMNHWFVCNKGFPNRSKVMTYDPYGSFTDAIGKDTSLSNFDRMWDAPPTKARNCNEHENFWRNFGHVSRVCHSPNQIALNYDTVHDAMSEAAMPENNVLELSFDETLGTEECTGRTLEELHSITLDNEKAAAAALQLEVALLERQALSATADSTVCDNAEAVSRLENIANQHSEVYSLSSALELKDSRLEQAILSPKTPESFIRKLSQAIQPEIRAAVALAPAASEEVLASLAKDPSIKVRCMLAQNPNVSMNVLRQLLVDENPFVAFNAKKTIDKRKKLMSHAN
jgi:hypothetical protein